MRKMNLLLTLACLALCCAGCDTPAVGGPSAMPAITADPGAAAERAFENDDFTLTIPTGWGMSMSGGDYYDLGTVEMVTFYDDPVRAEAGAFLTVSTDALEPGEDLERRANAAYSVQKTEIKDLVLKPYEGGGLAGVEATYRRPWGEPWWQFRDIWLQQAGTCYLLSFHSYPNGFDASADVFNAMLKSFAFKE